MSNNNDSYDPAAPPLAADTILRSKLDGRRRSGYELFKEYQAKDLHRTHGSREYDLPFLERSGTGLYRPAQHRE